MSTLAEQANAISRLRVGSIGLQLDMRDEAFVRRMNEAATMSAVAVRHGAVAENEPFGMPEGLGSFFSTIADLFGRWEFGLAGFIDELQGTGTGENPFERWTREVFSGVGGLKGDKETFGDIFEQAGLPDVSLSTLLTGQDRDWAFDPGLRGTIALGVGILSDPSTWLGMPSGQLSKGLKYIVGSGQEAFVKTLSPKGQAFALKIVEDQIDEAVKVMGISEHLEVDQVLKRSAQNDDLYRAVANDSFGRSSKLGGIADEIDDGFVGAEQVRAKLIDDTVKRIGDMVMGEVDDPKLFEQMKEFGLDLSSVWEKEGLRWRPFKIGKFDPLKVDIGIKVDLVAARAYNNVLTGIEEALKAKFPDSRFLKMTGEIYDGVHNTINDIFFRNTRAARKDPWYMARESRRFTMLNGGKHRAEQFSKMLFQGVKNLGLKDEDERVFTTFFAEIVEGTAPSIKQVRSFESGLAQARKMVDDPKDWDSVAETMKAMGFDYITNGDALQVEANRMRYFATNRDRFAGFVKQMNNNLGKDQLNFNDLVNKTRHTMRALGVTEVRAGLLEARQMGKNNLSSGWYFPRDHSKWSPDELEEFYGEVRDERIVRSHLGQYSEDRRARTFFGYAHAFYRQDMGHRVNWDIESVMANRLKAHYTQMINLDFIEDLSMRYGAKSALASDAVVKGAVQDLKISFPEMAEVDDVIEAVKGNDLDYLSKMLGERLNDVGRYDRKTVEGVVKSVIEGFFPYKRQREGDFAETIELLRKQITENIIEVTENHRAMAKWSLKLDLKSIQRGGLKGHIAKHGKEFLTDLANDMKSIEQIENVLGDEKKMARFLANMRNGRIATRHTGFINFLKRVNRGPDGNALPDLSNLTNDDLIRFGELWINQQRDFIFKRVKELEEITSQLNHLTGASWAHQVKGIPEEIRTSTWKSAMKEVFGKIDPEDLSRRDRKLLEQLMEAENQAEVNLILGNIDLTKTGARGRDLLENFRRTKKFIEEDIANENATWAFNMFADDMAKAWRLLDEKSPLKGLKLQTLVAEAVAYQFGLIDEYMNQQTLSVVREGIAGLSGLSRKDALAEMVKSGKLGTEPGTIFRRIFSDESRSPMDFLKMREFTDRFDKMRPKQKQYMIQQLAREVTTFEEAEIVMNLSHRAHNIKEPAERIKIVKPNNAYSGTASKQIRISTANGIMYMDLPVHIADDVEKITRHPLYPKEYAPIIEGIVWLNNLFKSSVTRYFPAFNSRNVGSNFVQSITDVGFAVLNPRYWRAAIAMVRGDDSFEFALKSGLRTPELRREVLAYGLIDNGDKWLELGDTAIARKLPHDIPKELVERGRKHYRGRRAEGALNLAHRAIALPTFFEDFGRALHYIALRDKGIDPAQAIQRVNQFMFDYGDLSDIEKLVFKNIFPFYTWTRKNAENFLRLLKEKPGAISAQTKIFSDPDRQDSSPSLPDYMRGDLPVRFHSRDNKVQFLGGIDIPIKNTNVLWAGGVGATWREHISMVTPLIKSPIEFFAGKDTFGEPTRGHGRIPSRLGAAIDRRYPEVMKKWLRFEKQIINGREQFFADRTMLYMLNKSLFMSRMASEGLRYDEMFAEFGQGNVEKGMFVLTKLLTGLSYREFDLDEAQRRTVYNNSSRLMKILDEKGLMRQFTTRYYAPNVAKTPTQGNAIGFAAPGPAGF